MITHWSSKRLILLATTTLLSISFQAVAADKAVIGTIVKSSQTTLSGIAVPDQGTLTVDATLATGKRGGAWVRFSADTQVALSKETSVRFTETAGQVCAQLSSGAIAASAGDHTLVVETSKLKIGPAQGKGVFVVALLPGDTTIVSARHGNVVVEEAKSAKRHLVPQGHYARISNAPRNTPGQAGTAGAAAAPPGLLDSTPVLFAIGLGSGIGAGFAIGEGPLGLGPASPSAP